MGKNKNMKILRAVKNVRSKHLNARNSKIP